MWELESVIMSGIIILTFSSRAMKLTVSTGRQIFSVAGEAHVEHRSCVTLERGEKPIVGVICLIRSFLEIRSLWIFHVACFASWIIICLLLVCDWFCISFLCRILIKLLIVCLIWNDSKGISWLKNWIIRGILVEKNVVVHTWSYHVRAYQFA